MKTNLSYDEQINQLIETAENNMKNNRYFFISVSDSEKFFHAVCGIGISDGVWEWNGEEYNKCVLTLDSNENETGFNEKSCIYINSETKRCYIPSHEMSTDNNISFAIVDDDTLLNYKGAINPSETINTDRWINIEFQNNGNVMNQNPYNVDISDNEVHKMQSR